MPWFTREICKTKLPRYHRTRGIIGQEYILNKTRYLTLNDIESYHRQNIGLLSALGIYHANVLTTALFYDDVDVSMKSCMTSIQ
jgi:hypothetical protein